MSCPEPPVLAYTGERMVPEKTDKAVFWEHIYRYRFAVPYVQQRRVLDIACGEGYGTAALLKAGATSVVGVDISEDTCQHAREKYGVEAQQGSAEAIPLPAQSIDVIVSFETIEHLSAPEVFLDECVRVLAPSGILVISTPNRDTYSAHGQHNPYHTIEFNEHEFSTLLKSRFARCQMFSQRPNMTPWHSLFAGVAENSPWFRLRGFWRVMNMLQSRYCPHILKVDEKYRQTPTDAILGKLPHCSAFLNPYCVIRRSRRHRVQPLYFLAVARL